MTNLSSIEVKENGLLVDAGRIYLNELLFTSNPFPLPAQYQSGLTDAMVIVRTPATVGTYNYVVKITDANGLSSEIKYSIRVGAATSIKRGVLLNQAGPNGTGGLDLDDAIGTPSASPLAEIKDEGTDFALPAESNWRQKISGVNGSEVRYIVPGMNGVNEAFDLSFVPYKEQLVSLWSSGVPFSSSTSNKVKLGDFFIVKNGDKYYLIETVGVVITPGVGDNSDYYEFDILR